MVSVLRLEDLREQLNFFSLVFHKIPLVAVAFLNCVLAFPVFSSPSLLNNELSYSCQRFFLGWNSAIYILQTTFGEFSCTKHQRLVFDGLHFEIYSLRKSWNVKSSLLGNNWERMFLLNRSFWESLNILNSTEKGGKCCILKNVHAVSGILLRPNLTVLIWGIMTFYLPPNTLRTTCLSTWTSSVKNPRKAVLASGCLPLWCIQGPPQWSRILFLFQDQLFSGGPQVFTWWASG